MQRSSTCSHLVFFDGIQQHFPGLAQISMHLHMLPGQLHSIERCLSSILRRLHGLPQQGLSFLQVTVATLKTDPPKAHHGQSWDCFFQGLQDETSLLHVAWAKKRGILLVWLNSSQITRNLFLICTTKLRGNLFIPIDRLPPHTLIGGLSFTHLAVPRKQPTAGGWLVSWADGWYTPSCRHVLHRQCCSPLDILHTSRVKKRKRVGRNAREDRKKEQRRKRKAKETTHFKPKFSVDRNSEFLH